MRRNIDWTKSRGMAGNRYPKKKIGKIVNLFSLVVRCGLIVKPKIRNTPKEVRAFLFSALDESLFIRFLVVVVF